MYTTDKPKISYFSSLGRFGNGLMLVAIITFGFFFSLLLTNSAGFNNVDIADPMKSVFPTMLIALLFIKIFDGFRIGVEEFASVVFSSFFAILFTDLTAIFLLFLYKKIWYNLPGFLLAMVIQTLGVLAWSFIVSRITFAIKKPLQVVVVCEEPEEAEDYTDKIAALSRHFCVKEVIGCRDKAMMDKINAAGGVFIIGLSPWYRNSITDHCFGTGKPCYLIPEPYDVSIRHSQHVQIDDVPVLLCNPPMLTFEQRLVKRIGDIGIALVALVISSPLMLFAAILVKFDGGSVLYKQERITYKYRKFNVYKFRTMIMDAEKKTGAMLSTAGDPRITKIGSFLRRTRLDELPQILNVLKGDMSFVGPRPERDEFIQEYIKDLPEFAYRLNVKAGLTGLAQVKGKYNTTPKDKLMLDLLYIRNYSLMLDIKILFQTLTVVFMKASTEGVKGAGKAWYKKKENDETK